jgi:hypothetical protein
MTSFTPRQATVVALLALGPVALFALGHPNEVFAVAAGVNVVLIFAVLWTVFGDHEGQHAAA